MEHDELHSFEELQKLLGELLAARRAAARATRGVSELLFRGMPDASWTLKTSLERWAGSDLPLHKYHVRITSIQREVESRTGQAWKVPTYREYVDDLGSGDYPLPDELYEFLAYLRHHGFPSPLLDWTRSPYIAAYFAFQSAKPDRPVAIYVYQEFAGAGKGGMVGAPRIRGIGPHVRTHPRHFLQQSEYTVALEGEGVDTTYCPHERVFTAPRPGEQDILRKIVLPGDLRIEVLRYLKLHNITAYSLFGSEEALMESVAVQEFLLSD